MKLSTRDADETQAVGSALAGALRPGDLVVLAGELGAGKTTFAKGVARGLGVEETVTSPTFTIVQEYEGRVPVAHVDVYRLDRLQELYDLGLEELLDDHVTLVEWGDAIAPGLPNDRLVVRLAGGADETRTIEFVPHGAAWVSRRRQIADAVGAGHDA
jgi:tRNA threonylcarbamoyladenosine biosynthesis protein TsaE